MLISAGLQLSLISSREWGSLFGKADRLHRRVSRSFSFCVNRDDNSVAKKGLIRSHSSPLETLDDMLEEDETELKKQQ